MCKSCACCSWQTTMPTRHHSLSDDQPTVTKHWRHDIIKAKPKMVTHQICQTQTIEWKLLLETKPIKPNWLTNWWHLQVQCNWFFNNWREFVCNDGKTLTRVILTFALHANGKLGNCLTVVHVCDLHTKEMPFVCRKHTTEWKLP